MGMSPLLRIEVEVCVCVQCEFGSAGRASYSSMLDLRTMIGVVGAPKRDATAWIHCAVVGESRPRRGPQSTQVGSQAVPAMQVVLQHKRARSIGRSSFTLRPTTLTTSPWRFQP